MNDEKAMKACNAMTCPRCRCTRSKVVDKRNSYGGVRRRRMCLQCGFRFTTEEKIVFLNKTKQTTV